MLTVGQELYFVPTRSGTSPYSVTVKKVGRKWAELNDRHRIDIETLYADGGKYISPGRCWLSRAEYDAEIDRQAAWKELFVFMQNLYHAPNGVSESSIQMVLELLRGWVS